MKFLLDSNLSHRVAQLLCDAGFDAVHVRDKGLQHATDSVILEFARQHSFVLVSEDTDFGELLARQRTAAPSFVLLRTYEPLTPDGQAAVLLANLPRLLDDLGQGAIVVIERSRLRGHCCVGRLRGGQAGLMRRHPARVPVPRSGFAGFRFPSDVIMVAVRWYLRYGLSYRDVEELLAERGITVDHVTVYRWVQRFTPLLIDAARPCRHVPGDRWFVDETYVKVAGRWVYLYRSIDQYGQVIDVLMSEKRDLAATRRFFTRALAHGSRPTEVSTDRAPAYPRVLDEVLPAACHVVEQYGNNPIEADHGRFKARLRPMRGLKRLRSAAVIGAGHAFVQNLRRGHYELGVDVEPGHRLSAAFAELALAL